MTTGTADALQDRGREGAGNMTLAPIPLGLWHLCLLLGLSSLKCARRRFLKVSLTLVFQGLGAQSPEVGARQLPGAGTGPLEDLLQSQVVVFLGQKLVERDVGVHGPHILP